MSVRSFSPPVTRFANADHTFPHAEPPVLAPPPPSRRPSPNDEDDDNNDAGSWGTDPEAEAESDTDWSVASEVIIPRPPLGLSSGALEEYYHKPWDASYPPDPTFCSQDERVTTSPATITLLFNSSPPSLDLPLLIIDAKPNGETASIGGIYQVIYDYFQEEESFSRLQNLGKLDEDIAAVEKSAKDRTGNQHTSRFARIDLLNHKTWVRAFICEDEKFAEEDGGSHSITWSVLMT